jgi:hypothetical protein
MVTAGVGQCEPYSESITAVSSFGSLPAAIQHALIAVAPDLLRDSRDSLAAENSLLAPLPFPTPTISESSDDFISAVMI